MKGTNYSNDVTILVLVAESCGSYKDEIDCDDSDFNWPDLQIISKMPYVDLKNETNPFQYYYESTKLVIGETINYNIDLDVNVVTL